MRPWASAVAVLLAGLVITGAFAWAAWRAYDDNESRLLERRTREAAAVLNASAPGIESTLAVTASVPRIVEEAVAEVFRRTLGTQVGPEARFASGSVWLAGEIEPALVLGEDPGLADLDPGEIEGFLERARAAEGMAVLDLVDASPPRLGYGYAALPEAGGAVVYVEQALPESRLQVIQPDSAFAGLDYAIYIGGPDDRSVLLASTPDLPLSGRVAEEPIAFGDATLTLVMAPTVELAGNLLARLPWIVLGAGAVVSAGAAALTERLERRRAHAELLALENARLFGEQRDASVLLQRSLLPQVLPEVAGLEIAVRYEAGVAGTEVGGDWYDVMADEDRAVLVIGDVSGRGLPAASVMASVRHSIRALAAQGDAVDEILAKVSRLDPVERLGHFATVLCGAVDLRTGALTFACAGHPPPLVVSGGDGSWIEVPPGPPIGAVSGATYQAVSLAAPAPGSTLLMVTDGLFERRGESIDIGLERLREVAAGPAGSLSALVDHVVEEMTGGEAADDTALLAVRWRP